MCIRDRDESDHTGVFTGFVLLSKAEWDKKQFIRDMKEKWDICLLYTSGLEKQGLSLPTADEWAYLCGGGCRTLFPWGDGMDYSMHLHHFCLLYTSRCV